MGIDNKHKYSPDDKYKKPYDGFLHRIQTVSLLTMAGCALTIFIVQRLCPIIFVKIEATILLVATVISFSIGFIWLRRDFLVFKDLYLYNLDLQEQVAEEQKKQKLLKKGLKHARKNH